MVLRRDVMPTYSRLQDFMESCIRPGGEEGVTEDEQTPQKYGNFSKAVFIISSPPNGEGTGGPTRKPQRLKYKSSLL